MFDAENELDEAKRGEITNRDCGGNFMAMAVSCDTESGAAYIALRGGIGPGETTRTVQACAGKINLDFDAEGYLIGIELLDLAFVA